MTIEIGASDLDFFFQLAAINPNTSLWNGHVITYSDGPAIAEAIESRIQAFFLTEDPDSASYLQAAAYFAHKGSSEEDRDLIEKDIIELLNTPEGLLARGQDGVIIPAGMCKSAWKFCKKHSKAILIGVAVVAVVTTVVVITITTAGTATGPAATAAASVIGAAMNDSSSNNHSSFTNKSSSNHTISDPPPLAEPLISKPSCSTFEQIDAAQVPLFPITSPPIYIMNDNSFIPKDIFGSLQQPNMNLYPLSEQHFANPLPPINFDPEYGPKFTVEPTNPSMGDHLRNLGSKIIHKTFEGVTDIVSLAPQLMDEIGAIGSKILPENILPNETDPIFKGSRLSYFEESVNSGHEYIDQVFGTNQTPRYLDQSNPTEFSYGWIPFLPGQLTKALPIAEFRQIMAAGRETVVIAEELGFSSHQICQLEQAGSLDKTLTETIESIYQNRAMQESYLRITYAEKMLKPYTKQLMSEAEAFARIQEVGMPTLI